MFDTVPKAFATFCIFNLRTVSDGQKKVQCRSYYLLTVFILNVRTAPHGNERQNFLGLNRTHLDGVESKCSNNKETDMSNRLKNFFISCSSHVSIFSHNWLSINAPVVALIIEFPSLLAWPLILLLSSLYDSL